MVKKALLIGINYQGTEAQLNGCINDTRNINSILVDNCGYSQNNVRVLTEQSGLQPTRRNIESYVKWLVSDCIKGDTLFFYYSGHGAYQSDRNRDESDGQDEVIVPLDYKTAGNITDDWLFGNLAAKVPEGVTLWAFTDCCHSGTMLDLKFNVRNLSTHKSGKQQAGIEYVPSDWSDKFVLTMERANATRGRVCLISGCLDKETSADAYLSNSYQGALSYSFIQFMKNNMIRLPDGSVRFNSGAVKLRNVLKEINCRLEINGFGDQNSQMSVGNWMDVEATFSP